MILPSRNAWFNCICIFKTKNNINSYDYGYYDLQIFRYVFFFLINWRVYKALFQQYVRFI